MFIFVCRWRLLHSTPTAYMNKLPFDSVRIIFGRTKDILTRSIEETPFLRCYSGSRPHNKRILQNFTNRGKWRRIDTHKELRAPLIIVSRNKRGALDSVAVRKCRKQ